MSNEAVSVLRTVAVAKEKPGPLYTRKPDSAVELNANEKQVAALLLQGCENLDIGQELGMALRTVKGHMHRMFVKFGLTDLSKTRRVQLALALYRRDLLSSQVLSHS
jgi:DNA-binding NarL/FixJ family response regulator